MRKGKHLLVSEWLIVVFFTLLAATTFLGVLSRYVFNFSLAWSDELARYCFVWLVFIGIVVSFVRAEHATVDFLMERYKGRYRVVMFTLIDVLIYVLFVVLTITGVMLMNLSAGQTTSGLGIPKMLVYAALPFGSALMVIELTIRLYKRFSGKIDG
jgi:TRAP-type C4-dicarboxylate transport system permease small subunit